MSDPGPPSSTVHSNSLSMNALEWSRFIGWPLEKIRRRKKPEGHRVDRGNNTVCLPEMLCGALDFASPCSDRPLLARTSTACRGWNSPGAARGAEMQGQPARHGAMEVPGGS